VISRAGVFLGVLCTFAFSDVADYLFRSHLLDVVGDAVEGVSDFFSQKEHIHVTDLVSFLLDVTIRVRGWMKSKKLYNKT